MVSTKRTVLVVEDDIDTSDVILMILSLHGYAMRVANNRALALNLLREHEEPDVMVVDWHMAGTILDIFVAEVRRLYPAITIVLISADPDLKEKAAELEIPHCLQKPFEVEGLVRLIDTVVQQKYT